jgi:hypothetical protein
MDLTVKERLAWTFYVLGSVCIVVGTFNISGYWPSVMAMGSTLITAAAGLGIQGLRSNTGTR